jgi:hypothetical protein
MDRGRLHILGLFLVLPAFMVATGAIALLPLLLVPLLMLGPALLFRDEEPPPGPPGTDDGGGGGGSPAPDGGPLAPTGGVPLPDARQGGWRLRDHRRPRRGAHERRPAHEPLPAAPRRVTVQ